MRSQLKFFVWLALASLPLPLAGAKPKAPARMRMRWTKRHAGPNGLFFLSQNGRTLVVQGGEKFHNGPQLQVWNAPTAHLEVVFGPYPTRGDNKDYWDLLALSAQGQKMIARRFMFDKNENGTTKLDWWNINEPPKLLGSRPELPENDVLAAVESGSGWKLLFDNAIERVDNAGHPLAHTPLQGLASDSVSSWGTLSRDGNRVALSDGPTVFDAAGHKIAALPIRGGLVFGLEFSPDNRFLVVARRQIMHSPKRTRNGFELWDLKSAAPVQLNVSPAGATPLWSPDANAVLGKDGVFRVARTGKRAPFQLVWPRAKSLRFDSARMASDAKTAAIGDGAGNVWFGTR